MLDSSVGSVLKLAEQIMAPYWKRKQAIIAIEADLAAAIIKDNLEQHRLHHQAGILRDAGTVGWYPLGVPRRVRSLLTDMNPLVPRILIAPSSWEDSHSFVRQVETNLEEWDASERFFHVVKNAVVCDSGTPRQLRGVAAAEVAVQEFSPSPSVILYCDGLADEYHVILLAAHLLPSTDGRDMFELRVASVYRDTIQINWETTDELFLADHPTTFDNVKDITGTLARIVAGGIASLIWVYWANLGVQWEGLSGLANPQVDAFSQLKLPTAAVNLHRIQREVTALEQEYEGVRITPLDATSLAVIVDTQHSTLIEIGQGFPQTPPRVWVIDRSGSYAELPLREATWSPERTLLELLQGVDDTWRPSNSASTSRSSIC